MCAVAEEGAAGYRELEPRVSKLRLGPLLPDGAAAELCHDIEVTEAAGVLLEEMEQHTLEGDRLSTIPAESWSTDVSQVVGLDALAEAQAAARAAEKTIPFRADYARRAGVEGIMHQAASHGAPDTAAC
jgi:hypothetical protein